MPFYVIAPNGDGSAPPPDMTSLLRRPAAIR